MCAIFLFSCLVLPFLGTYAWLSGRIESARESASSVIKKSIPVKDQLLWKFSIQDSKAKLHWEHSREFEYRGEMYDVIRTETKGDSVSYWCYWDRKETRLKKQLNVLLTQMMGPGPQSRNQGTQINDFFRSLYFQTTYHEDDVAYDHQSDRCSSPYHFMLSSYDMTPPLPPPRCS